MMRATRANRFDFTKIVFHDQDPDDEYGDERKDKNVVETRVGVLSDVEYGGRITYNELDESDENHFLLKMEKNFHAEIFSGMLFPAVRYNVPGLLIFERPPTNKMIQYVDLPIDYIKDEIIGEHTHNFDVPLPWQLYIAEYNINTMLLTKVHMYFMNQSLVNGDQTMYLPPLPNFFSNGSLCRPYLASMDDVERYEKSLSGIMASAYDWIWNSGFNHDLMEGPLTVYSSRGGTFNLPNYVRKPATQGWHRYVHPFDAISIFKHWEKRNLNNVLEIKWPNLSVTSIWDGEIEWFYENDPEYPYEHEGVSMDGGFDGLEDYSENYPIRMHDLSKSFYVMMDSIVKSSHALVEHGRGLSYYRRFATYHKSIS